MRPTSLRTCTPPRLDRVGLAARVQRSTHQKERAHPPPLPFCLFAPRPEYPDLSPLANGRWLANGTAAPLSSAPAVDHGYFMDTTSIPPTPMLENDLPNARPIPQAAAVSQVSTQYRRGLTHSNRTLGCKCVHRAARRGRQATAGAGRRAVVDVRQLDQPL